MKNDQEIERTSEINTLAVIENCLNAINDLEQLYALGEVILTTNLIAQRAFVQTICNLGEALTFLRENTNATEAINWARQNLGDGAPGFLDSFTNARNLLIYNYSKEEQPNSKTFKSIFKRYENFKDSLVQFKENLKDMKKSILNTDTCKKKVTYGDYSASLEGPLDYIKAANIEINRLKNILTPQKNINTQLSLLVKLQNIVIDNFVGNICTLIRRYEDLLRKDMWNAYHKNDQYINEIFNKLSETEQNFYRESLPSLRERIAHPKIIPDYDRKQAIENIINICDTYTTPLEEYLSLDLFINFITTVSSILFENSYENYALSVLNVYSNRYKARNYDNNELKNNKTLGELIKEFQALKNAVESILQLHEEVTSSSANIQELKEHIKINAEVALNSISSALSGLEIIRFKNFLEKLDHLKNNSLEIMNLCARYYYPDSDLSYTQELLTVEIVTLYIDVLDKLAKFLLDNQRNFSQTPQEIYKFLGCIIGASNKLTEQFNNMTDPMQITLPQFTVTEIQGNDNYPTNQDTENQPEVGTKRKAESDTNFHPTEGKRAKLDPHLNLEQSLENPPEHIKTLHAQLSEINAIKEENQKLKLSESEKISQLAALESAKAIQTSNLEEMKLELESKNQQITSLESEKTTLASELKTTKTEVGAKNQQITSLESEKTTLASELKATKTEVEAKNQQITTLESEKTTLASELKTTKTEVEAKNQQIISLESEKKSLASELKIAKEELKEKTLLQTQSVISQIQKTSIEGNDSFKPLFKQPSPPNSPNIQDKEKDNKPENQ